MATSRERIVRELEERASLAASAVGGLADAIGEAAAIVVSAYKDGKKLLLIGNGGSAAHAQHLATELVGRYLMSRKALPAIALTTDTSVLTALANDYGYDAVFSRQIEALAEPGDVLLAMTTSGGSPNILMAIETASVMGVRIVILTGQNGASLKDRGDLVIVVPSTETPLIQELHVSIGHIICRMVEEALFGSTDR